MNLGFKMRKKTRKIITAEVRMFIQIYPLIRDILLSVYKQDLSSKIKLLG